MIIFTGGGAIFENFSNQFECKRISLREEGIFRFLSQLTDGDIIVHNSANINPRDFKEAISDNYLPTKKLLQNVRNSGKKLKFIFISSMSILKNENAYKEVDSMNPYEYSKYRSEILLKNVVFNSCIVRFSTLFYADFKRDGLSKLIYSAVKEKQILLINNGTACRDFIPLDIAMQYLNAVCRIELKDYSIFNFASYQSISFLEISQHINEILGDVIIKNLHTLEENKIILCRFGEKSLNNIDRINFNLNEFILKYIQTIKQV